MNCLKILLKSLVSKRKVWVDTMMEEKIGPIDNNNENPIYKAITTFFAFYLIGLVPLSSVYFCVFYIF